MTLIGDLRRDLLSDEPDYTVLAGQYGQEALDTLRQLVSENDIRIAPKAVYLASLIEGPTSVEIVEAGIASDSALIRAAAGGALANLKPTEALALADRLLDDDDIGIRGRAVKSLAALKSPTVADRLRLVASHDSSDAVRKVARDALRSAKDRGPE